MKLINKTERWSMGSKTLSGRYKKYKCNISYSSSHYTDKPYWYFTHTSKEGETYNSLWDGLKYDSEDECHDACIADINTRLNLFNNKLVTHVTNENDKIVL